MIRGIGSHGHPPMSKPRASGDDPKFDQLKSMAHL